MSSNNILKWEITGFIFIIFIGTLLHFCFEWSGGFVPLAFFCAVNESVWEHLKLGFWPCMLFAFIEYGFWGKNERNFIAAKALSLYFIPAAIVALFYGYTAILGRNTLFLDISIFVLSVLFGQLISYAVITSDKDYSSLNRAALILIAALTFAFILFSYFPPSLELFMDPRTGNTGIP